MYGAYKYIEKNNTKTVHLGDSAHEGSFIVGDSKHEGAIMFNVDNRLMSAIYRHKTPSDFVPDVERVDEFIYVATRGNEIKMKSLDDLEKTIRVFDNCEGYDFIHELIVEDLEYVAEKLTAFSKGY